MSRPVKVALAGAGLVLVGVLAASTPLGVVGLVLLLVAPFTRRKGAHRAARQFDTNRSRALAGQSAFEVDGRRYAASLIGALALAKDSITKNRHAR